MKIYNRRNFIQTPSTVLRCAPTFTASPAINWLRIIDFGLLTTVNSEFSNYYIENDWNSRFLVINYRPIMPKFSRLFAYLFRTIDEYRIIFLTLLMMNLCCKLNSSSSMNSSVSEAHCQGLFSISNSNWTFGSPSDWIVRLTEQLISDMSMLIGGRRIYLLRTNFAYHLKQFQFIKQRAMQKDCGKKIFKAE